MSASILIIGSTGNTGAELVRTLPSLVSKRSRSPSYRILAQTRNASGDIAQEFAKLSDVEVVEKDWRDIDASWLRGHRVERLYIASQNGPTHFTDESLFLTAALQAGVKYVVRLSTTKANVAPNTPVFYGRGHWAVENLLDQPEFAPLQWTSLQPNVFTKVVIGAAIEWVQTYRQTGEKGRFATILDEVHGVGVVDPNEVGIVAAHLLASEDSSLHHKQKYVLAGPSDINGRQLVQLIEKYARTSLDDVTFRDLSWVKAVESYYPRYLLSSLSLAPASGYEGQTSVASEPTSDQVIKLYRPSNGALDALEGVLRSMGG